MTILLNSQYQLKKQAKDVKKRMKIDRYMVLITPPRKKYLTVPPNDVHSVQQTHQTQNAPSTIPTIISCPTIKFTTGISQTQPLMQILQQHHQFHQADNDVHYQHDYVNSNNNSSDDEMLLTLPNNYQLVHLVLPNVLNFKKWLIEWRLLLNLNGLHSLILHYVMSSDNATNTMAAMTDAQVTLFLINSITDDTLLKLDFED